MLLLTGARALWTALGQRGWGVPTARGGSASCVLTLDVNGDRSLLPAGNGFVGGTAHDALPVLDVGGGDEQRAHDALPLAVTEEGLEGGNRDEESTFLPERGSFPIPRINRSFSAKQLLQ